MAEVLHVPDELTAVHTLRAPTAVLDPATASVVEAAIADAAARARQEGELAGRRAAADEVGHVVGAIQSAVEVLHQEMVASRDLASRASLELASLVATAVLDRTPPDEALELLSRVERAVALLDVDPVTVRLHPEDHAIVAAIGLDQRLELIADPDVARGEARIGSAVAGAELTRRALLEAALAALGEGAV